MSPAAPRAENKLFATDTHSDCISATNALTLQDATLPPERSREEGETEERRGRNSECANYVQRGRESGSGRPDRLWDSDARLLGRPHPQRQQIPEIDNVDDNAALALTPRKGSRAASILEEGSPRCLPAYYLNTEKSTSPTAVSPCN